MALVGGGGGQLYGLTNRVSSTGGAIQGCVGKRGKKNEQKGRGELSGAAGYDRRRRSGPGGGGGGGGGGVGDLLERSQSGGTGIR